MFTGKSYEALLDSFCNSIFLTGRCSTFGCVEFCKETAIRVFSKENYSHSCLLAFLSKKPDFFSLTTRCQVWDSLAHINVWNSLMNNFLTSSQHLGYKTLGFSCVSCLVIRLSFAVRVLRSSECEFSLLRSKGKHLPYWIDLATDPAFTEEDLSQMWGLPHIRTTGESGSCISFIWDVCEPGAPGQTPRKLYGSLWYFKWWKF